MKTFIAYIVTIATVLAAAIFAKTVVEAAIYVPDSTGIVASTSSVSVSAAAVTVPSALPAVIPPAYPRNLTIPALGINANVQDVGITTKGNMGVPNNFTDVGWYVYGAIPGQQGTTVIDGHVDNGLGLAGVFKHLADIKEGDYIYVTNHAGKTEKFIVTDIENYGYENAPTSQIFGSTSGAPKLKLITCEGTWVPDQKTYDERLVVTAQPA